ncbi:MAG TPA: MFS transporter [Streptosporangiaceae bacterium]
MQGSAWGWGSSTTIGTFAAAGVAGLVTGVRTVRHPRAITEPALFRSREFTAAAVALFLFFIAFAAWLLITVLFLQDVCHYSAVRGGLAIAPGPLTAAVFAVNSGRIASRVDRAAPAITGTLLIAASAGYWLVAAPAHPAYVTGFLPGLLIAGAGAGLAQAPLFAAASTLPPDRATTGAAVLNMSRQLGSAVGIAILVALLASPHPSALGLFHRGWLLEIAASVSAAFAVLAVTRVQPVRQGRLSTAPEPAPE